MSYERNISYVPLLAHLICLSFWCEFKCIQPCHFVCVPSSSSQASVLASYISLLPKAGTTGKLAQVLAWDHTVAHACLCTGQQTSPFPSCDKCAGRQEEWLKDAAPGLTWWGRWGTYMNARKHWLPSTVMLAASWCQWERRLALCHSHRAMKEAEGTAWLNLLLGDGWCVTLHTARATTYTTIVTLLPGELRQTLLIHIKPVVLYLQLLFLWLPLFYFCE